jgi:hypothetical protein
VANIYRMDLMAMTDQTFYRALEEDYTDVLFETLNSRAQVDSRHSFIASAFGMQGCHLKGTKLFVKRDNKLLFLSIEEVKRQDQVVSLRDGVSEWGNVLHSFRYANSNYLKIKMKHGNEINVTHNHKLFTIRDGKKQSIEAKDLKYGDMVVSWQGVWNAMIGKDRDYYLGVLHGAYIADGNNENIAKLDQEVVDYLLQCGDKAGLKLTKRKHGIGIPKSAEFIRLGTHSMKSIKGSGTSQYMKGVLDGYVLCDSGLNLRMVGKKKLEVKFVSKCEEWIEQLQFLLLYFYGVSSNKKYRILKSGRWQGNKYYCLILCSESAIDLLNRFEWFGERRIRAKIILENHDFQGQARSCYKQLPFNGKVDLSGLNVRGTLSRGRMHSVRRCLKEGYIQKRTLDRWLAEIPELRYRGLANYESLFNSYFGEEIISIEPGSGDVFDIEVEDLHNYVLANGILSSNSGKSYASIALCSVLDPNFSVDNIYFTYDDLINNKHKLKPGMAVLVDEQSDSFGIDSHRVNIILDALKEQLRKKSIHFIFCSPTLKPEYISSMYVFETMFIDYESQECYAAMKTRGLLTLGYVRVPSPLKIGLSKEFMDAYEAKKDSHLDKLTGVKQVDEMEERAENIMATKLFKTAEKVYVKKMGYIPMSMLYQIINKLFPEFKSSIIVGEIAARIKLNKEVSGEWEMSGVSRTNKKKEF